MNINKLNEIAVQQQTNTSQLSKAAQEKEVLGIFKTDGNTGFEDLKPINRDDIIKKENGEKDIMTSFKDPKTGKTLSLNDIARLLKKGQECTVRDIKGLQLSGFCLKGSAFYGINNTFELFFDNVSPAIHIFYSIENEEKCNYTIHL